MCVLNDVQFTVLERCCAFAEAATKNTSDSKNRKVARAILEKD